jgi:SAM-dependent methyltransferase
MRSAFGASHYLSADLNRDSQKHGAVTLDALSFFSLLDSNSVSTIMAFGVFNEPMSLQYPAHAPPHFFLPANGPKDATRAHCEHEYVRRLAREMLRVLKPGGVLLGDGLHSRGVEADVRNYLLSAGFVPDIEGFLTLEAVPTRRFTIRDPFFFTKKEG